MSQRQRRRDDAAADDLGLLRLAHDEHVLALQPVPAPGPVPVEVRGVAGDPDAVVDVLGDAVGVGVAAVDEDAGGGDGAGVAQVDGEARQLHYLGTLGADGNYGCSPGLPETDGMKDISTKSDMKVLRGN